MIAEIHQFNSRVTVSRSLDLLPVKVNLSDFVLRPRSRRHLASQGRDAGIGYAEEGRWMWQSDVKLTKTIEKAIAIAEGASTFQITSPPVVCRRRLRRTSASS